MVTGSLIARAAALTALLVGLALPGSAGAAPPGPGIYAVSSSCEYWGVGKTKRAAIAACDKKVAREHMPKSCRCSRGAEFATFAKAPPVAFYLAGPSVGHSAAKARAACTKLYRRNHTDDQGTCKRSIAAYGPFPFPWPIDENPYVYLTEDGYFVDASGESPCFPAGTLIATPSGERPIETLKPGDAVLSWSVETGRATIAHVTRTKVRDADLVLALGLADGRVLRVTPNHPLWTPDREAWTLAGEVAVGDRLAVRDDAGGLTPVAVVSVGPSPEPGPVPNAETGGRVPVYDLTVLPTHAYFAGGLLVHNY